MGVTVSRKLGLNLQCEKDEHNSWSIFEDIQCGVSRQWGSVSFLSATAAPGVLNLVHQTCALFTHSTITLRE